MAMALAEAHLERSPGASPSRYEFVTGKIQSRDEVTSMA